jgi:prolyl-tRNA synthetase
MLSLRLGQLLFQSLREDPAGAQSDAERLLMRAGFMRHVEPASRVLLPLGALALRRITDAIRDELQDLGSREVILPAAEPDAGGPGEPADEGLPSSAMAREIFRSVVRSHRQIPSSVFAVRGISRQAGQVSVRGSDRVVADVFVAEAGADALAAALEDVASRVRSVLSRLETPVSTAQWTAGVGRAIALVRMGGGDDMLVCSGCGYAADSRVSERRAPGCEPEDQAPLEEVETPDATTIASLAAYLGVDARRCAKAAIYAREDGRLLTAIVRGDNEVSEVKLAQAAGASRVVPATEEAIRAAGMEPGYGSPVGIAGLFVVADPAAAASPNMVAGANRAGFHLRNVNAGRDYVPDVIADIARAVRGDGCPRCPGVIDLARGTPLATWSPILSSSGLTCADATGGRSDVAVGVVRIEVERILAAVVAEHHDERGISWPDAAAPFGAHVVVLSADRDPQVAATAAELERALRRRGSRVLWDDRDESPGVKFADADLIGAPLRLTVSPRSVAAGGVEVTRRRDGERSVGTVDETARLVDGQP